MAKPKILTDIENAQSSLNTHSADSTRHITSGERTSWNGKADGVHTHPISQVTNLQTELNAKETPSGAQAKANTAETNAKNYAMNTIAVGSVADPNTTTEAYIMSSHANTPPGSQSWHIHTYFYSTLTGNRAQTALSYNGSVRLMIRQCTSSVWTPWLEMGSAADSQTSIDTHINNKANPHAVTKTQIGLSLVDNIQQATKAEFNTHNNDNVAHVTASDRTTWNSKAAGTHTHTVAQITGLQAELNAKETPEDAQIKVNTHATDAVKHITAAERSKWNVVPVLTKKQATTTLVYASSSANIGISGFNKATDVLLVFQNTTFLTEGEDYDINAGSTSITKIGGSWEAKTSFVFLKLSV